ncbi:MAG: hypothetical protein JRG76_10240 [Deltaproteobacteria bacterium]|nr:hypothetical protein [Deltaproteobacteria bacterium]MBW2414875.1 hypothetical protein [Deltaproteobacteria bacterium]
MTEPAQDEAARPGTLSIEQLSDLREKTEAVSELLRTQLAGHVETIRPILAPPRLLGKHVRSGHRSEAHGADAALRELKQAYAGFAPRPFGLQKELTEDPISVEGKLELYPWEYGHDLEDGKTITMTSPMRWVLAYRSGYTLAQLRKTLATKESRRTEDVRQFVASAIALKLLIEKHPEISDLFRDLRYEVSFATCDGLGDLPLTILSSSVGSVRPDDELIKTATRFSGVPAFIELIDQDAAQHLRDPLRERIASILG